MFIFFIGLCHYGPMSSNSCRKFTFLSCHWPLMPLFPLCGTLFPASPLLSPQITAAMCLFLMQLYFNPESRGFFCYVHFCFVNCGYVSINMMSFLISSSLPRIFMKDGLGFSCRQLFHCYNQVYSRESDRNTHRVGDKLKM